MGLAACKQAILLTVVSLQPKGQFLREWVGSIVHFQWPPGNIRFCFLFYFIYIFLCRVMLRVYFWLSIQGSMARQAFSAHCTIALAHMLLFWLWENLESHSCCLYEVPLWMTFACLLWLYWEITPGGIQGLLLTWVEGGCFILGVLLYLGLLNAKPVRHLDFWKGLFFLKY